MKHLHRKSFWSPPILYTITFRLMSSCINIYKNAKFHQSEAGRDWLSSLPHAIVLFVPTSTVHFDDVINAFILDWNADTWFLVYKLIYSKKGKPILKKTTQREMRARSIHVRLRLLTIVIEIEILYVVRKRGGGCVPEPWIAGNRESSTSKNDWPFEYEKNEIHGKGNCRSEL